MALREGKGDITATTRHARQDSLTAALSYPLASSRFQLPLLREFVAQSFRARTSYRARIVVETAALLLAHVAALSLYIHVHGARLGAMTYFFALAVPALLGTYWMMLTNYLQHVGCDPDSADEHSRNFVSPLMNWLVFDNGFHTVHHEHPGMHWSRYRALHRARASHLQADLNAGTLLGYALRRYLLGEVAGRREPARRSRTFTDVPES